MDNRLSVLLPCWEGLCEQAQRHGVTSREDFAIFRTRVQAVGLPKTADELSSLGRQLLVASTTGLFGGPSTGPSSTGEEKSLSCTADLSVLPRFMYNAWSLIFNDDGSCRNAEWESGALKRWNPTPQACVAYKWLRQLTAVFSKLKLPYDGTKITEVADRFIANERLLRSESRRLYMPETWEKMSPSLDGESITLGEVLLKASKLISRVLSCSDPKDIIPRHGSGASACGRAPWVRYTNIRFHPSIHRIWPYHEYCTYGDHHAREIAHDIYESADHDWFKGYTRRAKCVFVPKDYRGPRLISEEPAESMYWQLGSMTRIVNTLQSHKLTRGFINFTDQTVNQRLALRGSLDSQKDPEKSVATLDLQDASDLVSWPLVHILWPREWLDVLDAVRSRATVITSEGIPKVIPLMKHAPMGSALCFPVMALTIWAIIKAATPPRTKVWVYGDDIVVNSRASERAIWALEAVSLKINRHKSFRGPSPFRESCGEEYFNGSRVTPVYLRLDVQTKMAYASSLVTFANQIAKEHGDGSAFDLVKLVHSITGVPVAKRLNVGERENIDLLYLSESNPNFSMLWQKPVCKDQPRPLLLYSEYADQIDPQGPPMRQARMPGDGSLRGWKEMRICLPVPVYAKVNSDAPGYLLRALLIGGSLGSDARHAVANRVRYKYRWVHGGW